LTRGIHCSPRPPSLYCEKYECIGIYEGWNFNIGNYLFTTDTK